MCVRVLVSPYVTIKVVCVYVLLPNNRNPHMLLAARKNCWVGNSLSEHLGESS